MAEGSSPKLRVATDPTAAAAEELARALANELARRELVRLAVPGGSALEALAAARARLGRDWSRVSLTWVDERCVPVDDPASNRGAAMRLGLLEDPAPAHVVPLFEDGESPAAAVARASGALRTVLGDALDVLLLGMGEDGHIASLFPSRRHPGGGSVAWVADSPKPPADRITLTRAVLGTARHTTLLATGEAKRPALVRLLAGDRCMPAQGLPGLVIVTDLDIDRSSQTSERKSQ